MLSALVLTFCTKITCEEYVIDHNLTRSDCIERLKEERNDRMNETNEQVYKDAVGAYKAVPMKGKVVSWELSCVKDSR